MNVNTQSRNVAIDILRVLGTSLVILAHVNAPTSIQFLRSFDVCLLVMISGYCCSVKQESYLSYAIRRIKRLAVPAWITMTLIFILGALLCLVAKREYLFSGQQIIETYLFIGGREGGIGIFWIVRIYLLMALVAPFLLRLNEKLHNNFTFIATLVCLILGSQLIYQFLWGLFPILDFILENFVLSTLAYAAVYLVGMRLKSNKRDVILCIPIFVTCFVCAYIWLKQIGEGYIVSDFKYPPQFAYVSYGIAGSVILFFLVDRLQNLIKRKAPKTLSWLSSNSFNIYLAHAVVLRLLSWGDRIIRNIVILKKWYIIYFVVVLVSCSSVWIIQMVIQKVWYKKKTL